MPPTDISVASNTLEYITAGGFSALAILNYINYVKLKMSSDQNQKDHKAIREELKNINGAGRKATDDISRIEARCEERHVE
jgi:hypothetical protein